MHWKVNRFLFTQQRTDLGPLLRFGMTVARVPQESTMDSTGTRATGFIAKDVQRNVQADPHALRQSIRHAG